MIPKMQKIATEAMARAQTGDLYAPTLAIQRAIQDEHEMKTAASCRRGNVHASDASYEMIRFFMPHRFAPLQEQRSD